jgi:hypothetical protein
VHPTAGNLTLDDIQRRLNQQISDLHLDERVAQGRERLAKYTTAGRERVGKLWADLEAIRRERRDAAAAEQEKSRSSTPGIPENKDGAHDTLPVMSSSSASTPTPTTAAWASSTASSLRNRAAQVQKPDTAAIQAAARDNAVRAGAYLSSWGSWARERGKEWRAGAAEEGEAEEGTKSREGPR